MYVIKSTFVNHSKAAVPKAGATWTQTQKGVYITDKSFYEESGGILQPSPHYEEMFKDAGK